MWIPNNTGVPANAIKDESNQVIKDENNQTIQSD